MSDNATSSQTNLIVNERSEDNMSDNSRVLPINQPLKQEHDATIFTIKKEENKDSSYEGDESDQCYEENICNETRNWIVAENIKPEPSCITDSDVDYQQDPLYISNYGIKNVKEEVPFTHDMKEELKELTQEDTKYYIDIIEHKVQIDDTSNISATSKNGNGDNIKQSNSCVNFKEEDIQMAGNRDLKASFTNKNKKHKKYATLKKQKLFFNTEDNHNSYECFYCCKLFKKKTTLSNHLKKTHKKIYTAATDRKLDNTIYKEIRYECDQCQRTFALKSSLTVHVNSVHKGSRYKCDLCPGKFTTKYYLTAHVNTIHKGLRYKCNQCEKEFTQKSKLKQHENKIHKGRRYECDQCKKLFVCKYNLTHHFNAIHNVIWYECDQCQKKFTSKTYVTRHVKSIHKKFRYECDLCYKQFTEKSSLTNHKNSIHKRVRYKCKLCGATFTLKSSLLVHVVAAHKKIKI